MVAGFVVVGLVVAGLVVVVVGFEELDGLVVAVLFFAVVVVFDEEPLEDEPLDFFVVVDFDVVEVRVTASVTGTVFVTVSTVPSAFVTFSVTVSVTVSPFASVTSSVTVSLFSEPVVSVCLLHAINNVVMSTADKITAIIFFISKHSEYQLFSKLKKVSSSKMESESSVEVFFAPISSKVKHMFFFTLVKRK